MKSQQILKDKTIYIGEMKKIIGTIQKLKESTELQ